ncbi:UDP-glucose 4-epimerase GalE [Candidatus Poriferisodalis sp.]|uniref:UDP-glucose 4-epimerase GalE n=1 Tax=Candidatus Poriferisodalis sp. TaxID=3101277 RepID=UPI003B018CBC
MTTLVSGGAGYVGSHTVAALHEAGRDVVVLDDFSNARRDAVAELRRLTTPDLVVIEGDAADRTAVRQLCDEHDFDSIMHFAAHKSVPESFADPLRYYRNNLLSTLSLAEIAVERGIDRFVFSSSAVVYGTPEQLPVSEETPPAPQSPYGTTKLMCERILADTAASSAMQAVILRYFNPVGAHPSGRIGEQPITAGQNLVPAVMRAALGALSRLQIFGDDYDTRDGTAVRDFVHVTDLAAGHVAALQSDLGTRRSRVFNLGTGAGTTVLELVAAAEAVTGRPIPCEIVGRRPGDIAESWADCSRAEDELGWRAQRDLRQMLADHWRFASSCAEISV